MNVHRRIRKHLVGNSNTSQTDHSLTQYKESSHSHTKPFIIKRLCTEYINKMNKTLVLMNIQLSAVLRDITGVSGLRVIQAILQGERDPKKLEQLVSTRCKADRKDIEKALVGDFRPEYLFELKDCYDLYMYYWDKIHNTDKQIEELLKKRSEQHTHQVNRTEF